LEISLNSNREIMINSEKYEKINSNREIMINIKYNE